MKGLFSVFFEGVFIWIKKWFLGFLLSFMRTVRSCVARTTTVLTPIETGFKTEKLPVYAHRQGARKSGLVCAKRRDEFKHKR